MPDIKRVTGPNCRMGDKHLEIQTKRNEKTAVNSEYVDVLVKCSEKSWKFRNQQITIILELLIINITSAPLPSYEKQTITDPTRTSVAINPFPALCA